MIVSRRALAAIAGMVMGLAGCGDGVKRSGTIALADCRLAKLPVAAQCAALEVPEDRANPDGRRIVLAISVLPANTLNPRADPLFILAGGPGQAASFLGPFAASLTGVRKDRDIVLVDQRGTGRSSPLTCGAFKPDESAEATLELDPVPKATACAAEIAAQGVDASQYTTAAWVADLDAARAALGYATINLWGGSYGTRVALEYLRRFPARVRSIVLDGVVPPGMRVNLDVWPSREIALSAVLEACAQAPSCRDAHPDLPATLDAIRDRLGPRGQDVAVTDPRTGETLRQHITFDHVIAALQPLTYSPELSALLPEIIGLAASGDYGALFAGATLATREATEQINNALYYSVTCTEDAPRIRPEDVDTALRGARARTLALRSLAVCDVWPRQAPPEDASTPVKSAVPALILSGGLDPVTPPTNGAAVARTLPAGRHIVARGYGHIVSPHACGPRLIAAFVDHPDVASLPASCVEYFENSRPPPLWPDRLGAGL